ncbi:alpha/beta-hydrolase [Nadsonia fulvescens var. elongata DSM 6958]|uniref:Alpha/beta-hydrolase n=1 Tax=Nadsonia fulvescens var. elongata DSM 6958 TaxID=857566 RepID=A0A1E3PSN9_9ASCO|nr:alpha/beta-hydrolase [Nadsonia fulvescens var. elongata DSM 6958]
MIVTGLRRVFLYQRFNIATPLISPTIRTKVTEYRSGCANPASSLSNYSTNRDTQIVNNSKVKPIVWAPVKQSRAPRSPSGVPLKKILSNIFPLSVKDSLSQWKLRKDPKAAEDAVLSLLPFYPDPDATRSSKSLQIPVGSKGWTLHEFEITNFEKTKVKEEMVFLHGYGAGLAFFYQNLDQLSRRPGWKIHALDMLGYGNSSRPKFVIKAQDPTEAAKESIDFFVESLEQWRIAKGIEKFTLVAHSLGAYIHATYVQRYPDRVKEFVLVSPAAIPQNPFSITSLKKSKDPKQITFPTSIPKWFGRLWERNVSPFTLVRASGPLGPRFVSGWTSRRFAHFPKEDLEALHLYTYTIFIAPGSGEYALNYLLGPGAFGRLPLEETSHHIPVRTTWLYGDRDWMDVNGGIRCCRNINQTGGKAELFVVKDSGHHIYWDNPTQFEEIIIDVMKRVEVESVKNEKNIQTK